MLLSALYIDKEGTSGPCRYPVTITPCQPWDDVLTQALSGPELQVGSYWTSTKVAPLLALHVSASGKPPHLRLLPQPDQSSGHDGFASEHEQCSREKRVLVVNIDDFRELFLIPMKSIKEDGTVLPVFWGYVLYAGVATIITQMLEAARMGVVFDLDETLLIANSQSTLATKIREAKKNRNTKNNDLQALLASGTGNPEEEDRLRCAVASAAKEMELLQADLNMLTEFATNQSVTLCDENGNPTKTAVAKYEEAILEDGTRVQRPVIRLQKPLVYLTMITPGAPLTSMIMRPRPFWDELRSYLAGDQDAPGPDGKSKQRFDVYVCTAAERTYALEVWRLLDVKANIIPHHLRSRRIINVSGGRKKLLLRTLGMDDLLNRSLEWSPLEGEPPLPLVTILDDRLDVWEPAAQPCILQVMAWYWYRDEAAKLVGGAGSLAAAMADASETEVRRMRNALAQLRADTFYDINERLKLAVERLMVEGVAEAAQVAGPAFDAVLGGLRAVPSALQDPPVHPLYMVPTYDRIVARTRQLQQLPPGTAQQQPSAPAPAGQALQLVQPGASGQPPQQMQPLPTQQQPGQGPVIMAPPQLVGPPGPLLGPAQVTGLVAPPVPGKPVSLKPKDPRRRPGGVMAGVKAAGPGALLTAPQPQQMPSAHMTQAMDMQPQQQNMPMPAQASAAGAPVDPRQPAMDPRQPPADPRQPPADPRQQLIQQRQQQQQQQPPAQLLPAEQPQQQQQQAGVGGMQAASTSMPGGVPATGVPPAKAAADAGPSAQLAGAPASDGAVQKRRQDSIQLDASKWNMDALDSDEGHSDEERNEQRQRQQGGDVEMRPAAQTLQPQPQPQPQPQAQDLPPLHQQHMQQPAILHPPASARMPAAPVQQQPQQHGTGEEEMRHGPMAMASGVVPQAEMVMQLIANLPPQQREQVELLIKLNKVTEAIEVLREVAAHNAQQPAPGRAGLATGGPPQSQPQSQPHQPPMIIIQPPPPHQQGTAPPQLHGHGPAILPPPGAAPPGMVLPGPPPPQQGTHMFNGQPPMQHPPLQQPGPQGPGQEQPPVVFVMHDGVITALMPGSAPNGMPPPPGYLPPPAGQGPPSGMGPGPGGPGGMLPPGMQTPVGFMQPPQQQQQLPVQQGVNGMMIGPGPGPGPGSGHSGMVPALGGVFQAAPEAMAQGPGQLQHPPPQLGMPPEGMAVVVGGKRPASPNSLANDQPAGKASRGNGAGGEAGAANSSRIMRPTRAGGQQMMAPNAAAGGLHGGTPAQPYMNQQQQKQLPPDTMGPPPPQDGFQAPGPPPPGPPTMMMMMDEDSAPPAAAGTNEGGGAGAELQAVYDNPIVRLNEVSQRLRANVKHYVVKGKSSDPTLMWTNIINWNGMDISQGHERGKKEAKRLAAQLALDALRTGQVPNVNVAQITQWLQPHMTFVPVAPAPGPTSDAASQPRGAQHPGEGAAPVPLPPAAALFPAGVSTTPLYADHVGSHALSKLYDSFARDNVSVLETGYDMMPDGKVVRAQLTIRNIPFTAMGIGPTKKYAKQHAAILMLHKLGIPLNTIGLPPGPPIPGLPDDAPLPQHQHGGTAGPGQRAHYSAPASQGPLPQSGGPPPPPMLQQLAQQQAQDMHAHTHAGGSSHHHHHHHHHHHQRQPASAAAEAAKVNSDDSSDEEALELASTRYLGAHKPKPKATAAGAGGKAASKAGAAAVGAGVSAARNKDYANSILAQMAEGLEDDIPAPVQRKPAAAANTYKPAAASKPAAAPQPQQAKHGGYSSEEEEGEVASEEDA